jgi:hypothetical protein
MPGAESLVFASYNIHKGSAPTVAAIPSAS